MLAIKFLSAVAIVNFAFDYPLYTALVFAYMLFTGLLPNEKVFTTDDSVELRIAWRTLKRKAEKFYQENFDPVREVKVNETNSRSSNSSHGTTV